MREILFRGKDLQERNGWLYGYFYKSDLNRKERESGKATLIFTPNCDTFIYVPEYHNSWMVKPETVGQYTGLTDKNGTRIFEGDIVEYEGERYSINYLTRYARFSAVKPKTVFCVFAYQCGEVIGNIHDNPELLKGDV